MITDTCKCGAIFTVTDKSLWGEYDAHKQWLKYHDMCRVVTECITNEESLDEKEECKL